MSASCCGTNKDRSHRNLDHHLQAPATASETDRVKIVSDFEMWRSAHLTMAYFGDRATARAQKRADECRHHADVDGWMKWIRIAEAILEIEQKGTSGREFVR